MRRLVYVSHANVVVEPDKPVPLWSLSDEGRRRHVAFGETALARSVTKVFSSAETKAVEAARASFPRLASTLAIREAMHENDRSATGFLAPPEFWPVVERFFAEPTVSVRGWERAVDAQGRIVAATERALAESAEHETIALVGHGGVGTLLYCHLAGLPIARHDQPGTGGGNVIVAEFGETVTVSHWQAMEDFAR
ncbi:histidine phosphatase family protein [Aureimonas leprariae]|uniref:Histidine phosphatase family protein n=1 Tax=Plantimonas leprariae TaxID=2615207 RepID=A0A7V7PNL6_9HYPH|nr:histidine phosphatase family protein [Aureimonas leprariae]KAB0679357.1 histidine phosphatase family protein [Aureimonas leprariae]